MVPALPQPASVLPGHHAPTRELGGNSRYPAPLSEGGGPIATALLYEDGEIRVWEHRQSPRWDSPVHSHALDYWLVTARVQPTSAGAERSSQWPGTVVYVRRGAVESAANPSDDIVVKYLVELKATGLHPTTVVDALPSGWGASAAVLYENVEMRVWDLRLPPGQSSSMPPAAGSTHVLQVDVRGDRGGGSVPLEELSMITERYLWLDPSCVGTAYCRPVGEAILNAGAAEYRGVVFEAKEPADLPAKL